jgi:ribosomal protein S18 acetylase RimI-like enzyme
MTPSPALTLRPADARDRDAIADIWHASASLPSVGPPVMPSRETLRQRVDAELAAAWVATVAVAAGRIVGFVAIKPGEAVLAEIFVAPDAIGAGAGRALLDHAKAAMPQGFTLFTRSGNARARAFYERAGLVAFRDDLHPRSGDPIVYYRWAPGRS